MSGALLRRRGSVALDCLLAISKPAVRRTLHAASAARSSGEPMQVPLLLASTRLRSLAVLSHAAGQARSSLNQQLESLRSYAMAMAEPGAGSKGTTGEQGGASRCAMLGEQLAGVGAGSVLRPASGAEKYLGDDCMLGWTGAQVSDWEGSWNAPVESQLMAAVACTYCDTRCEQEAREGEMGYDAGRRALARSLVEYCPVLLEAWGQHAALWLAGAVRAGRVKATDLVHRLLQHHAPSDRK